MKTFLARSAWAAEAGMRLDAATYASGGLEARDHIRFRSPRYALLSDLAELRYEGRFARNYVRDESSSVPFLTASDMLLADLKGMLRLSIKRTPQLSSLLLQEGWTLLSRSGTIGKVVFVRGEMVGMAASDDIIRCTPRPAQIRAGYMFAFLSTAHAQAMIRQKTYGNVVQHIEPEHIADMPVPIPDAAFQERIHGLVTRAAEARTEASQLLDAASGYFDALAGPMPSSHDHAYAVGIVRRSDLSYRLDAFNHVGWATEARFSGVPLGALGRVSRPGIVKRIFVQRGVPFISGIDAFQIMPDFRQQIMRAEAERGGDLVMEGQILIQRSGQRYGLIGRPAYVAKHMDGWAASEHLMRVSLYDTSMRGPVFAFFRSDAGRRALMRSSYGTSIPELNPEVLAAVQIPSLPESLAIGANRALELREEAFKAEEQAIREVEAWVG